MNKDVDERLLPKGEYRTGQNIRVPNTGGSDVGAIENPQGNLERVGLDLPNAKVIGALTDDSNQKIYWFVTSDTYDLVVEFDAATNNYEIVLQSTANSGVLNFDRDYLVTGVVKIINEDFTKDLLVWTDKFNPPRMINIERAKTYAIDGFSDESISVAKAPPSAPPTLTLSNNGGDENNLEDKFLRFAYRYKHVDGQYTAISPLTEVAFLPREFSFDFSEGSNTSMVNRYNSVDIEFNTGSEDVVEIELLYKESSSNNLYVIETFKKEDELWEDSVTQSFTFDNTKSKRVLPENALLKLYDNVPKLALALEKIGSRIAFANYTENYNIEDCEGNPIKMDFTALVRTTGVTEGQAVPTCKSNRDYEIGIVYKDSSTGRMTTVLTSQNNDVQVPIQHSDRRNEIKVLINHLAPCGFDKYQFFIKQNKGAFDTIVPSRFYRDGVYAWLKLEGNDASKVSEGDFIVVKSDTAQILDNLVRTRVLEVSFKAQNFLEADDTLTTVEQVAGTYMKVKVDGFDLNESDYTQVDFDTYATSNDNDPIRNNTAQIIEEAVYYGLDSSNDDMVSNAGAGSYTALEDRRYLVEIDSVGATDTFRWSDDGGTSWTSLVAITGVAQALSDGVTVTFGSTTGHALTDNWVIPAKYNFDDNYEGSEGSRAYWIAKGLDGDTIQSGTSIQIIYDEYNESTQYFEQSYTATRRYDNLEEFCYKEGVVDDLIAAGISENRIWFRTGTVGKSVVGGGPEIATYIDQTGAGTDTRNLIIRSTGAQNSGFDNTVKIRGGIYSQIITNPIVFETDPDIDRSEVYQEIGRTYNIDTATRYHLGNGPLDFNQSFTTSAILVLPFFNAFSWGNGFESAKVRDAFQNVYMGIDSRPLGVVEDYKENDRRADITYSEPYNENSGVNGLSSFDLSRANYKDDIEKKWGSIQRLYSRDTNLVVFQEDKVSQVLFGKDLLMSPDGSFNITAIDDVLGQQIPYAGEFGISTNPESFAFEGGYLYFADRKRGAVLRLAGDGLTEISDYGMRRWFIDRMKQTRGSHIYGAFDPYNEQYVISIPDGSEDAEDLETTLVFDERVRGWVSFYTYTPDYMIGMNNTFYSFYNGDLWEHDSPQADYNTFYGVRGESKVCFMFNDEPSVIKMFLALSQEGTSPWKVYMEAYQGDTQNPIRGNLYPSEFEQQEGVWKMHIKGNEDADRYDSLSSYGIGRVNYVNGKDIHYLGGSGLITSGDSIYLGTNPPAEIGVVDTVDKENKIITLVDVIVDDVQTSNAYIMGVKNARLEGGTLRGYTMKCELTIDDSEKVELFAVNAEVETSFPV